MKMTGPERTPCIADGTLSLIVVLVVAAIFLVFTRLMMRACPPFLGHHWNKKFSFAEFVKQEQFYIYILLFFLLLVGSELLLQNEYSF